MFPENRFLELLIIGALALIVVGPKDLPVLMRRVGQFVGKMRAMAAEFRASFDELARQSELDELRKEVEALRRQAPTMNPLADPRTAAVVDDINQGLASPRPSSPPPEPEPQPQPKAADAP
jgi:sec-independent protein translocase protein TatB